MEPTNEMGTVLMAAYTAVAAVLAAAGGALAVWLSRKAQTHAVFAAIAKAWEVTTSVVAYVEVSIRPTVKKSFADGKLTPEEAKELRDQALELVKAGLGAATITQLEKHLGGQNSLTVFLRGLIERALGTQRAAGTLPPPPPLNTPAGGGPPPGVPTGPDYERTEVVMAPPGASFPTTPRGGR
jgi:hypothetical protein